MEEVEPVERQSISGDTVAWDARPIDRDLAMARAHHFLLFLCIKWPTSGKWRCGVREAEFLQNTAAGPKRRQRSSADVRSTDHGRGGGGGGAITLGAAGPTAKGGGGGGATMAPGRPGGGA